MEEDRGVSNVVEAKITIVFGSLNWMLGLEQRL
jgi:hypothetical protein